MFPSYSQKYYKITAIDEFSRMRVLEIVKEKSIFETDISFKWIMDMSL